MRSPAVETMFMRYLLLPILAIILVFLFGLLRKKNALLDNRKVIVFALVSAIAIGLPGFIGAAGAYFSARLYFIFQLLYAGLGILYLRMLQRHISARTTRYRILTELVVSLFSLAIGIYVFSLLYNLFNPIKNGLFIATAAMPLLIPLLFHWSYQAFLEIPPEIYKVWNYLPDSPELDLEGLDFDRMMVIEVEFSRQATDEDLLKVKAKAPANVVYGDWFQKFINDYNTKFPASRIAYAGADAQTYGWIFYVKPTFFRRRRYIDPTLSITDNRIQEVKTIVCKRVINQ
jgi:hypothetical protein